MITDIRQLSPLVLRREIERPAPGTVAFLGKPFRVEYHRDGELRLVIVPTGFPTDLASVPRMLRGVVSKVTGIEASIAHDWLYDQREGERADADRLFYEMLKLSESRWKAWIMYRAVRAGGGIAWRGGEPWVAE